MAEEEMDEESTDEATRLRELQEELSDLNALEDHRGYKRLMKYAEIQQTNRKNNLLLTALHTMDEVLEQEYHKGEYAGIQLFIEMRGTATAAIAQEIQEILKSQENRNANSKDDSEGT